MMSSLNPPTILTHRAGAGPVIVLLHAEDQTH